MITFDRTFDYELVKQIITHPRIWPYLSDDYSPPASEFRPIEHPALWYVIARDHHGDDTDLLGLWMFVPQNGVCWEVHTALLPCAWGPRGQLAARLVPAWIWANTTCRRIITNVPSSNRLARHFALKAGMKIYGINRASWLKNGVLYDQICLGLSAEEKSSFEEAPAEASLGTVLMEVI